MPPSSEHALAIENAARYYEHRAPEDILTWALETYHTRIVLACSFGGPSGIVALDMALRIAPKTPVYYLDTGLLFPETYELVERIAERYGIEPIAVKPKLVLEDQAKRFGAELWRREPDTCCAIRKLEPQRAFLASYDAWISGIRRDQTLDRQTVPVVQWDELFDLVKINPLALWDEAAIWEYIRTRDLPYNALHDRGYASIGCRPCTRAVSSNESGRAGRWPGLGKTECGLHLGPRVIEAAR